jgi:hypothetical protein
MSRYDDTIVIPGRRNAPDPESRGYHLELPGSRFARPGMTEEEK